jgi:RNA polymerase sigma factor (sigma-70 family)
MSRATSGLLLRHIERLVSSPGPDQVTDRELLRQYSTQSDEAAFAMVVRRHGAMVWHVCRRALTHEQDAEDAFQATFLVLARKAATVRWHASVASWLYGVAQRLALKARAAAARRPATTTVEPAAPEPCQSLTARELLAAVDAEVAALAERYRGPLVLCRLEGRTQEETARLLGTSLSSVRRRLDHAERLLRARLTRRGLAPCVAVGTLVLAPSSAPAVPAHVLTRTMAASPVSPRVAALAESLPAGKIKIALAALLAGAMLVGVGFAALWPAEGPSKADSQQGTPMPPAPAKMTQRVDALGDPLPPDALVRLGSIRLRHGVTLQALAYSPAADVVATGGWNPTICLWDLTTGKEQCVIAGPEKGVYALAYSPDGKLLGGGGLDGVVYLWDAATGKEVRRLEKHGGEVHALAFSPRGDMLAAGANSGLVSLWQVAAGKLLGRFDLKEKEGSVTAMDFDPDGKIVAVASDKEVHLWNTETQTVVRSLRGHTGPITSVLFSRDSKSLITVGPQVIRLWETASGKKLKDIGGKKSQGSAAALSPDGTLLAVGDSEAVIRLWDWANDKQILELPELPDRVRALAFSRDGKTLAALADGAPIHLWDVATGKPAAAPGHQERVTGVACMPDGRIVVTAGWDGTVRLWDAKTGKELRRMELDRAKEKAKSRYSLNPATIGQLSVSQDGKLVAAVRGDEVTMIWDAATGKEVRRYSASCVAFSPDGKLIASGERGREMSDLNKGVIRLYDRATGKELRVLRGHLTQIASLAFTPDSGTILSQGMVLLGFRSGDPGEDEKKFLRVWDVATGKERQTSAGGAAPRGTILARDGRTAASFSFLGKNLQLWEVLSGGQRGELTGNTEMIFDAAISPDGRIVASAGMDGTIRLWDPFQSKEIGKLEGHRAWVQAVAFAPDGKTLISGSMDTTALIWDVSRFSQRKPVVLTADELQKCWEDLGRDAEIAYRAIGRLLTAPDGALEFLRKHLKSAPTAPRQRIAELLADLDSKEFKTREQAARDLEKLGDVAAPAVQMALAGNVTLETRRRLELLLQKLEGASLPPETLRQVRAVEVLNDLGRPEAKALLERLAAEGAPEARLTREAKAALRQ